MCTRSDLYNSIHFLEIMACHWLFWRWIQDLLSQKETLDLNLFNEQYVHTPQHTGNVAMYLQKHKLKEPDSFIAVLIMHNVSFLSYAKCFLMVTTWQNIIGLDRIEVKKCFLHFKR